MAQQEAPGTSSTPLVSLLMELLVLWELPLLPTSHDLLVQDARTIRGSTNHRRWESFLTGWLLVRRNIATAAFQEAGLMIPGAEK